VHEVWQEWTAGLDGGPAVKALECVERRFGTLAIRVENQETQKMTCIADTLSILTMNSTYYLYLESRQIAV
jgi:hypothetical protein